MSGDACLVVNALWLSDRRQSLARACFVCGTARFVVDRQKEEQDRSLIERCISIFAYFRRSVLAVKGSGSRH